MVWNMRKVSSNMLFPKINHIFLFIFPSSFILPYYFTSNIIFTLSHFPFSLPNLQRLEMHFLYNICIILLTIHIIYSSYSPIIISSFLCVSISHIPKYQYLSILQSWNLHEPYSLYNSYYISFILHIIPH